MTRVVCTPVWRLHNAGFPSFTRRRLYTSLMASRELTTEVFSTKDHPLHGFVDWFSRTSLGVCYWHELNIYKRKMRVCVSLVYLAYPGGMIFCDIFFCYALRLRTAMPVCGKFLGISRLCDFPNARRSFLWQFVELSRDKNICGLAIWTRMMLTYHCLWFLCELLRFDFQLKEISRSLLIQAEYCQIRHWKHIMLYELQIF